MARTGVAVAVLALWILGCGSGGGSSSPHVTQVYPNLPYAEDAGPDSSLEAGDSGDSGDAVNEDAACTEIQASSYDQSCATDSDCTVVSVGEPCGTCAFQCEANVGAINVGARDLYTADVRRSEGVVTVPCNCPPPPPDGNVSCCRGGQCHANSECMSSDAGLEDAGAE
jgi:hypothetical protein